MKYTLTGNFYEACDCDVVCSCWVGRSPPMGSCTGLFVWEFDAGNTIDVSGSAVDVGGCRVMLITQGSDCDNADNAIVLLSGPDGNSSETTTLPTPAQHVALESALLVDIHGPWANVVKLQSNRLVIQDGLIVINSSGDDIRIDASGGNAIKAKASMVIPTQAVRLQSSAANTFIARSTSNPTGAIDAGWIALDPQSSSGLDILATATYAADEYVFDLDITDVSAVRGKFAYITP